MKVGSRDNGKTKPADSTCWRIRSKCFPNSGLLAKESLQVWLHVYPGEKEHVPSEDSGGQAKSLLSSKREARVKNCPHPHPSRTSPRPKPHSPSLPLAASFSQHQRRWWEGNLQCPKLHIRQSTSQSTQQRRPQGHSRKKKNRLCGLQLIHPLGNDILAHLCGRFCAA